MKKLIEWGVTGMFTNFPDHLEQVIDDQRDDTNEDENENEEDAE